MPTSKPLIVLFEDHEPNGVRIEAAIRKELPTSFRFLRFDDRAEARPKKGTYEDRIAVKLKADEYAGLMLIITDRDLSMSKAYHGLSEAVVSKVAAELGVPVCIYAAGRKDSVLERQRSGGDSRIILDSADVSKMAHQIIVIAKGFVAIAKDLPKAKKSAVKGNVDGLAMVIANLLGRKEVVNHLSLYAAGDQKMISELMPVDRRQNNVALKGRLPMVLGYWLFDSVLRFPGLLVNQVAASSYLNIDPDVFSGSPAIKKLFDSALYSGPFSDQEDPKWWRDKLDDILQRKKVADGRDLVKLLLNKAVKPCVCSVDKKSPAGFYCVVTHKPVGKKNSHGQISWLPRGADLSRVRQDKYDELAPWIGLS